MPNFQGIWSLSEQYQNAGIWPIPPLTNSDLGIIAGGQSGASTVSTIQYLFIATTGNTATFGNLSVAGRLMAACASSTRAIFWGGLGRNNVIDYIEMASASNAVHFGDISTSSDYQMTAHSSETRGIVAGLKNTNAPVNVIEYITIATIGNSLDFGDLTVVRGSLGSTGSTTRIVFAGGRDVGTYYNTIDYATIASTGNATDFGDLLIRKQGVGTVSSSTRACFGGAFESTAGGTVTNQIEYVTIASTGNATDFGDLTVARYYVGGMSNKTRGVFAGGDTTTNVMDYVTIASAGNATDFGDMSTSVSQTNDGTSNAHGGLA